MSHENSAGARPNMRPSLRSWKHSWSDSVQSPSETTWLECVKCFPYYACVLGANWRGDEEDCTQEERWLPRHTTSLHRVSCRYPPRSILKLWQWKHNQTKWRVLTKPLVLVRNNLAYGYRDVRKHAARKTYPKTELSLRVKEKDVKTTMPLLCSSHVSYFNLSSNDCVSHLYRSLINKGTG